MTLPAKTPRDLIKKLIIAELLAKRGEGPLALRRRVGVRLVITPKELDREASEPR